MFYVEYSKRVIMIKFRTNTITEDTKGPINVFSFEIDVKKYYVPTPNSKSIIQTKIERSLRIFVLK